MFSFFFIVGLLASAHGFRFSSVVPHSRSYRTCTSLDATVESTKDSPEVAEVMEKFESQFLEKGEQFKPILDQVRSFMEEYTMSSLSDSQPSEKIIYHMSTFINNVAKNIAEPHPFEPYHKAVREPFDYYKWGNEFFKPLIIEDQSRVLGLENARRIKELIAQGDNVVILSNHQTEVDPQVLSLLLADIPGLETLAQEMIFVAGHKVTSDPVAIPFSIGRNLICIHSKKHIRSEPEKLQEKQAQNLQSMQAMSALAAGGGHLFWVAPSGGRDRPNEQGRFSVSPFDAKTLDSFKIIAMQSKRPMHFFPMAMYTHQLIPPPDSVSSSLGEERSAKRGAVSAHFLPETDGLGGLKDKEFTADVLGTVDAAYKALSRWHRMKAGLPPWEDN